MATEDRSVELVTGTLLSILLTEIFKALKDGTMAYSRCRKECEALQNELLFIQQDVDLIEARLLRLSSLHADSDDLKMAQNWLNNLYGEMEKAKKHIEKFNNRKVPWRPPGLLENLKASSARITTIAANRAGLYMQLPHIIPGEGMYPPASPAHAYNWGSSHHAQQSHHNYFNNSYYATTSSQPEHHHVSGGMHQNYYPQHGEYHTSAPHPPPGTPHGHNFGYVHWPHYCGS
uniref:Rx N-terminal domain-containing protein n=1 Tax=Physcomitrium patens TaxID=3218 RepID=A0A2K1IV87_PHYPA|nr:uncharacterized protein LOC112273105 [Physcomitrium patens]PNR33193.1 hypothetical protein PHYPA_025136 [Physcomitrium patens]|eukprot:XP_024357270.1 uncharacterized protein LOC112273105 [Physcomitrella patens]